MTQLTNLTEGFNFVAVDRNIITYNVVVNLVFTVESTSNDNNPITSDDNVNDSA